MSQRILATTFSPAMLRPGMEAKVSECPLKDVPEWAESAVGHEVTAKVISALLGRPVEFKRTTVELRDGAVLYCIVPTFRADVAREFTQEEVTAAGFRCFRVEVHDASRCDYKGTTSAMAEVLDRDTK